MRIQDENGKEHIFKCKKCKSETKPLIGGNHKELYCQECLNAIIEERKAKIKDRVVLKEEPKENKIFKKK